MPPPRLQRLVRRQPLTERIRAVLNPMDFYLWLSEEIQTLDWDSKTFGTRFGLAANFVFLLARANAGGPRDAVDDVFGDAPDNGWVSLLANFLQWILISLSVLNAFYTMTRSRNYRLFEVNVESAVPGTHSAQRVRVDSSPASSTPLRLIHDILRPETAEQRAHPDKTRDVWEMRVWDPYPATLRMFCLFSPGHVLIHMLFLPLPPLDPRPSVTVFKCFLLQVIVSAQLLLMHSRFSQQSRDMAIIQKEVMHEYDVKYVHPRLHPVVREVSTQVSISDGKIDQEEVNVGTPATLIRRSFQTHPNPNYVRHVDPSAGQLPQTRTTMSPKLRPVMSPSPFSPASKPGVVAGSLSFAAQVQQQRQSALRRSLPASATMPTSGGAPGEAPATSALAKTSIAGTTNHSHPPGPPAPASSTSGGFGGSLGVYTHMKSPLKKATSLGDMNGAYASPRNSREMAALEQRELADRMVRQSSPHKESHRLATTTTTLLDSGSSSSSSSSYMHSPEKLARARANRWTQERFPSRRV